MAEEVRLLDLHHNEEHTLATLHKSREARTIAFDILADLDQDNPEITDELVQHVGAVIDRSHVMAGKIKRSYVRNWLENPGRYAPHVDEVAMHRAINFDHAALNALSADENDLLLARLYVMGDKAFDYYAAAEAHFYLHEGEALQRSPRRVRYLNLPKELQVKLRDNVTKTGAAAVGRWKELA